MTETTTTALKQGDQVIIAEHDDSTRQPRPGGRRLPAHVKELAGAYVLVTCDDPRDHAGLTAGLAGRHIAFWAESGWRAWDGAFFWRLETCEPVREERR